jgi:hypothetical protein
MANDSEISILGMPLKYNSLYSSKKEKKEKEKLQLRFHEG